MEFANLRTNEARVDIRSNRAGIRSLHETRRLDQSETVKVARAVKQIYQKLGAPPQRPEILVALCLISSAVGYML